MNSHIIHFRPPRIAMALVLLAAVLHLLVATGYFHVYSSWQAGGAVFALGFAIMIGAWWQFRAHQVAICPTAPTARLITGGLYRWSRNPMYLGMVAMLLGLALVIGTVPFYAAALLLALIMDRHFCTYEEQKLRDAFGDEFSRYAARVRRWL